jgi:hypothetical protein
MQKYLKQNCVLTKGRVLKISVSGTVPVTFLILLGQISLLKSSRKEGGSFIIIQNDRKRNFSIQLKVFDNSTDSSLARN